MAKGIILGGTTGAGGKLVITDFDPTTRTSYKAGREMDFSSSNPVSEGYLVQGTVSTVNGALLFTVASILDSSPTIITTNQSGAVTIGTDQSYYVKSTGQITGNVSVNGGVLLVSGGVANGNISIGNSSSIICNNNATVGGGTFQITGGGSNAVISFKSCTVNGLFSTTGITLVDLGGNNFNGNVSSSKDKYVIIKDNVIGGTNKNLTVSEVVDECSISGNTVSGTITLDPKCQP